MLCGIIIVFGAIHMKTLCLILAATILPNHGFCADQSSLAADTNSTVFRQPFTLTLHVDKEHYYEEKFGKIPYVHDDNVYLFKGDAFGIDLDITNEVIRGVSYQADTNKAAVSLRFTQEIRENGEAMMLLVIKNHTKRKLFIDALMTVPQRTKAQKTSILPVEPGLTGYESWPHPIVQLVLRNIRLTDVPGTEQDSPTNGSQQVPSETNRPSSAASSHR
jgi:hypothetical protein